jgi:hypothetical protein
MLPVASAVALALAVPWAAPGASADTAPVPPDTQPTVSADVLPTVQVNGVVWAQLIVGNRVYATGSFTSARPAGAPAGTGEVARRNILAYDLTTGALIPSWNATLNGQGLALAASPDGKRIYVAGDFTNANGVNKGRIVALDAATGAISPGFKATVNGRVRALATSGPNVYAGGAFTIANGTARNRLTGFKAADGALIRWNPGANGDVYALVAPAGKDKIVAGGRFTTMAGAAAYGMGATHWTSGASLAWPANTVVRNAGADAAIYSLSTNGTAVFGTGYTYLVNGADRSSGNFEGTFAANAGTGNLVWVTGCRGDTYSSVPIGRVLYSVGHNHDCSSIGGNPQTPEPWQFQRANASTLDRGPNAKVNVGGRFDGRPAPLLLHWLPTLNSGTFTGQSQAAWSVTGNANYVVVGGEFPTINGTAQQGLARFAVRSIAPNKEGANGYADLKPTLTATGSGVTVGWKTAWDRDNARLTYEVLRGATLTTSVVLNTRTIDSNWWTRPAQSFTDSSAPSGSQTYRIRVTDPLGNVNVSQTTTVTVP